MCQLTLVDTKNQLPSIRRMASYLPVLNSVTENNLDGTGYVSFSGKFDKSKDVPYNFFTKTKLNPGDGLYHVRRASNKSTSNITDDKAHPFITKQNTFILHNGFFTPHHTLRTDGRFDDIVKNYELMDTQKFAATLEIIQGDEELNEEHIKQTLKFFTGPFVIMVGKLGGKDVYVVRGKDRFMHYSNICNSEGEIKGIVFNTQRTQLDLWASAVERATSYVLTSPKSLGEYSLYKYEVGAFAISEPTKIEQAEEYKPPVTHHYTNHQNYTWPASKVTSTQSALPASTTPVDSKTEEKKLPAEPLPRLLSLVRNFLSIGELRLMSHKVFKKDLLKLNAIELNDLMGLIERLKEEFGYGGRIEAWFEYIDKYSLNPDEIINIYSMSAIKFPYFLNSKDSIKLMGVSLKDKPRGSYFVARYVLND